MIDLTDVVGSYIESKDGWSVRNQFIETFSESSGFDEQNPNALRLIKRHIESLINSDGMLSDNAKDDLEYYLDDLERFLNGMGENEDV